MIVYFQDCNTDKILSAPDIDIAPNEGERVIIDAIWYVVCRRIFHINNHSSCTIYVKEEADDY